MSDRNKKHNSIIFLTTLSVYLSLSLLGATPQVLAYAATTRDFDIQTEIEYKDDFDNKPDSEEIDNAPAADFPLLFAELLTEIKNNIETGKIVAPLPQKFLHSAEFEIYRKGLGSSSGSEYNTQFDFVVENALYNKFQRNAIGLSDFVRDIKTGKTSLESNDGNWSLNVSFNRLNAAQYADFLSRKFSVAANSTTDKSLKQIYENTKVSFKDNQVFVVTNLPRAGIDALIQ